MKQHSFQEVLKQWGRMCRNHICDNRDDECEQITPLCPLVTKHAGYPCDEALTDLSQESIAQLEEIVMQWAAENPEPAYPLWGEWLLSIGAARRVPTGIPFMLPNGKIIEPPYEINVDLYDHIPADIAEKLGIEPKEGKTNE